MTFLIVSPNRKLNQYRQQTHVALGSDQRTLCGKLWCSDRSTWSVASTISHFIKAKRVTTCESCRRRMNPERIGPIVARVMARLELVHTDPHVTSVYGEVVP